MKKFILSALLCFSSFSLFAQSREDISIVVPAVSGNGSGPDDSSFFSEMIRMEVVARGFALAEVAKGSDYSMTGTLAPYKWEYEGEEGEEELTDEDFPEENYFSLHIALVETGTGKVMVEQDMIYMVPEETNEILPLLIFNMFANIPMSKVIDTDIWRHKWWYIGLWANWTPRIYMAENYAANIFQFGISFLTEFHFLNFMSVEAGIDYAQDSLGVREGEIYTSPMLEIPVLLKFVLKPTRHFMIEPYGGIQLNAAGTEATVPPLLSWVGGIQYGVRAGPGGVFLDARFVMDIGDSHLDKKTDDMGFTYQRALIKFGVGYKYGFFLRPVKKKKN